MNDLKLGVVISLNSQPYTVIFTQHIKMARSGATMRTKLKNLVTGATLEKTFSGGDRIEEADLARRKANVLYRSDEIFYFMDAENFEQYELNGEAIGEKKNYLKEGQSLDVLLYNGRPIGIELPKKIVLTVASAPPGVRGDTSGTATKTALVETGFELRVPLFIKTGDQIRINTDTGEYVERA